MMEIFNNLRKLMIIANTERVIFDKWFATLPSSYFFNLLEKSENLEDFISYVNSDFEYYIYEEESTIKGNFNVLHQLKILKSYLKPNLTRYELDLTESIFKKQIKIALASAHKYIFDESLIFDEWLDSLPSSYFFNLLEKKPHFFSFVHVLNVDFSHYKRVNDETN